MISMNGFAQSILNIRKLFHQQTCDDDMAFYRLLQAGLVKGSGNICTYRCDLYRQYFEDKL